MAKKGNVKKVKEIIDATEPDIKLESKPFDELTAADIVCKDKLKTVANHINHSIRNLNILELQAYEGNIKMLLLHYEKMLRLDEIEGRPVMSANRNMFTRFSNLHNKIMKYIENKVLELEQYDWE